MPNTVHLFPLLHCYQWIMFRSGFTFAVPLAYFCLLVDNNSLVFKIPCIYDILYGMVYHSEPFFIYSCKKPASLYVGNIILIFIETITTNFNIFYGMIANQGANTMITPKTTIICLPNDTIFGAFHAKKLASLSIMSAVTYRTTPNDTYWRKSILRSIYFCFFWL